MSDREKWFIDRIGKVVFRNKTTCKCKVCDSVYENGLTIEDNLHASYLYDCETIYTAEGHPLKYFDEKDQSIEFEADLKIINSKDEELLKAEEKLTKIGF